VDSGEDEVIYCEKCQYTANAEKASSVKAAVEVEEPLPVEEVSTPGAATIQDVCSFLGVDAAHTLKAVFYMADGEFVFVVIRGDIDVNEIKLKNVLHCTELRLATDGEVGEAGVVAGVASPVGLKGIKVIADESVRLGANFVAGGNKLETHLKNVNYPRDFEADVMADISLAHAGEGCPKCGNVLTSMHGIEVGHIFKLGTFFSEKLGAMFIDEKGKSHPVIMGCYGIGIGRLLAAAIEQNHDDKGIIWPMPIAPYHIYLCPLYREGTQVSEVAEKLYEELEAAGMEVLFNDRKESPGVKFNDADLLGIPVRVTVSARTLEKDSVELKMRAEKETSLIPVAEIVARLKEIVGG